MATQATLGILSSPNTSNFAPLSLQIDDGPPVDGRPEMSALLLESSQQVDQSCAYVKERHVYLEQLNAGKSDTTFKFSPDPSAQRGTKVFDGARNRELDESQREITPLNLQDSSSDISYLRSTQPRSRKGCYCLIIAAIIAAIVGGIFLAKSLKYL